MFAFSGLTGSALVFYQDIDEFLNPGLLKVEPGEDHLPLSEITLAAQKAAPVEAKPSRLYLPRHPQMPIKVRFSLSRDGEKVLLDVMVNPYTAEALGQREWGGYLMSFLYKIHYTLALGDIGESIMGAMGALLIGSIVTGLVLWRPKLRSFFQAFTFRRSANLTRFIYDLHKTIGAYSSVVLLVIAFSGIYMIFPQYVKPLVGMALSVSEPSPFKQSAVGNNETPRVNVDEVETIARDTFPQAELQRIFFPASADSPYRVIMRQPGEIRKTSGNVQLWISTYDGDILKIQEPQSMPGGDAFLSWMFPLHNGEAFGLPGRILVFLTGFVPITLYATGLWVWWRKRKARLKSSQGSESDKAIPDNLDRRASSSRLR
ncbi:MAG: PepSY domain-containing protein [Candidatus Nitrohelix vancouverensis]|uniref:PepSY domain-containing protein n=1 Tax=Candidatus Nitrohelix vancouverensis TaxID=2705534 RepID=A0A7T0G4E1_9BACT|nr:MAG: PepSY domain-containing protein [Candidatus Nitrohelix vancouverensis]